MPPFKPVPPVGGRQHEQRGKPKVGSPDDSEVAEKFLHDMLDIQRQQQQQSYELLQMQQARDHQLQQLLGQHQQLALTTMLPNVKVSTYSGDPVENCHFIRSFENLIESKTFSNNTRLYYLVQYTSGDVQELMRSCLSMSSEEGYNTARKLLKQHYEQSYRITTAYLERITKTPEIKAEDGEALQRFSVQLTSCKNTLKEIGYLNKLENPDSLQNVISRLPYPMRRNWRDVADDIISNKKREITFEDIASFVEVKARILTHPIFGKINNESRNKSSPDPKGLRSRYTFGMNGKVDLDAGKDVENTGKTGMRGYNPRCPMCNNNHLLSRCDMFKKETVENRRKLVRKRGLCDNCLFQGHIARVCPKESFVRYLVAK